MQRNTEQNVCCQSPLMYFIQENAVILIKVRMRHTLLTYMAQIQRRCYVSAVNSTAPVPAISTKA